MEPTEKQLCVVRAIIKHYGTSLVEDYLHKFYKTASLTYLTRAQAQKIITGLGIGVPDTHRLHYVDNPEQYFRED